MPVISADQVLATGLIFGLALCTLAPIIWRNARRILIARRKGV